jgi:hypothetical protein
MEYHQGSPSAYFLRLYPHKPSLYFKDLPLYFYPATFYSHKFPLYDYKPTLYSTSYTSTTKILAKVSPKILLTLHPHRHANPIQQRLHPRHG